VASNSKKKTTSKKTNTRSKSQKRNTKQEEERNTAFLQDVILFSFLAVTVLLFISNLGLGGLVGGFISGILFGLFGLLNYIFPIVLALSVFFYYSNRENSFAKRKLIYSTSFYIFACVLIDLICHGENTLGGRGAYLFGTENHNGGGFFGGLLSNFFMTAFGLVGSYVITALTLLIMVILISEKSGIEKFLEQKESYQIRKAEREERRRQEELEAPVEVVNTSRTPYERRKSGSYEHDLTSNVHQGRRVRKVREQELTTSPATDRIDRRAKGVTMNTKLEPHVHVTNPNARDEISEITEASILHMDSETPVHEVDIYDLHSSLREENIKKSKIKVAPVENSISEEELEIPKNSEPQEIIPESLVEEPLVEETHQVSVKANKPAAPVEAEKEQPLIVPEDANGERPYVYPPIDLLKKGKSSGSNREQTLQATAARLKNTLNNFGINISGDIQYVCGPTVTRYEFKPEVGVKVSKIVNLTDDIKMNLAATDIRIEAPVPGRDVIGIEVPNKETTMVAFRTLIESNEFKTAKSKISFAAGMDIGGKVIISDIAKMPHLLIAGATGSGKSVCINTIIMSILYHARPDEVKLIMIDPKVVELSVYNEIPHLLIPVVTDPKKAAAALNWAVNEMTERYKAFADNGVRDMAGYNSKIKDGKMKTIINGEEVEIAAKKMPQLVVIVDELADLMMVSSNEVEDAICRLAQLARAAGIHLVIATQRPSVNVITGIIKANMPSRIAFSVTSNTDSRTILDMGGAEKLLGKGDMLYYPQGLSKPIRVQGAFVSDEEVSAVVSFLKQNHQADYDNEAQEKMIAASSEDGYNSIDGHNSGFSNERDDFFPDAARLVIEKEKGSIGMLQRAFKIGFNRAARIMDQLEEFGVVGPEEGTKPRKILITIAEFEELLSKE